MIDTLEFPQLALRTLAELVESQSSALEAAAEILAATIENGDIIQGFGTGHSRAVVFELCGRAGGLAPTSMLAVKDLVMFGGVDPAEILDPKLERDSGLARRIYELAGPSPGDAFVIVSNSGINSSIVEMARLVRERGHQLIAITSFRHSDEVASRDASGARLRDFANVAIDNGAPTGDAGVRLSDDVAIGGLSNLTGIFLVQTLVELAARRLLQRGIPVPVFVSGNLPDGDDRNRGLIARYADRVRPIEP